MLKAATTPSGLADVDATKPEKTSSETTEVLVTFSSNAGRSHCVLHYHPGGNREFSPFQRTPGRQSREEDWLESLAAEEGGNHEGVTPSSEIKVPSRFANKTRKQRLALARRRNDFFADGSNSLSRSEAAFPNPKTPEQLLMLINDLATFNSAYF